MINERPRFAIDDDGSIFDYQLNHNHGPLDRYIENGFVYDMLTIKRCILSNDYVIKGISKHVPVAGLSVPVLSDADAAGGNG